MEDSTMKFEVEVPRSQVIIARKLADNAPVKESIQKAIATFTSGWESGVALSKSCINEISSLLNVKTFNSEASLIDAIEKRFNTSPSTVVFEVDPSLANLIKRKAVGTDVPFNEYVRRFVHSMFRYGILDWGLKTIFFQENEWKRAKAALGSVPSTGENLAKVLEEWAHMKAGAVIPASAPQTAEVKKDELSASERNIQQAMKEDEERKRLQHKASAVLDPHSMEYRQKLAESMNRMTAPKKPEVETIAPGVETVATEANTDSFKVETDANGQAADVEIPNF